MSVIIRKGDPHSTGAAGLLKQSHALMESLFPPEDNFYLDLDALCAPHIAFFVAEVAGEILGTAALADMDSYGEIKSMFVSPDARGLGVGGALLVRLEDEARTKGHAAMMLETGNKLEAALRLYARAGFCVRGPFGNYPEANSSLFMEKLLS
ncbi:MAG: GNAT family N-acetyltransferase [Rhodobacteraceae bacterium]|nr:GNAT family N-acetyltransferase [Paracoccaceae bacterium]